MVFGVVGIAAAAVAIPLAATSSSTSVIGIAQGTNAGQQSGNSTQNQEPSEEDKNDPRLKKFTVRTHCDEEHPLREAVDEKQVVLRNGKFYLDEVDPERRKYKDGHAFAGFYLEYPWLEKPLGLVSTIKPEPPELNWIFLNKKNLSICYGNKTASLEYGIAGPWDWTEDMEGITFAGEESFVAMEESPGDWLVCYDAMDDMLQSANVGERVVLAISLDRVML